MSFVEQPIWRVGLRVTSEYSAAKAVGSLYILNCGNFIRLKIDEKTVSEYFSPSVQTLMVQQ